MAGPALFVSRHIQSTNDVQFTPSVLSSWGFATPCTIMFVPYTLWVMAAVHHSALLRLFFPFEQAKRACLFWLCFDFFGLYLLPVTISSANVGINDHEPFTIPYHLPQQPAPWLVSTTCTTTKTICPMQEPTAFMMCFFLFLA